MGPLGSHMYEYDLCWLVSQIKNLKTLVNSNSEEIKKINQTINAINSWIDQFSESNFKQWIIETVNSYIATMIFVEISDAGYIVYYIPETWNEITFNTTGLDIIIPEYPEYGRLVLTY